MADQPLRETIIDAAIDAEVETGRRETSRAQALRAIAFRLARITAGFLVLLAGVVMLVLPGPGLVVIAAGLVILARDFVWADRLLTKVRARLPRRLGGKKTDADHPDADHPDADRYDVDGSAGGTTLEATAPIVEPDSRG